MKYVVGFSMTGTVEIDGEDMDDALETAYMLTLTTVKRKVKEFQLDYIEDENGENRLCL